MKKVFLVALLLCVCASLLPGIGFSEDESTLMLAQTLYTLAGDESDETMLQLGSVIMNRVDSVWFPDSLEEVLNEPHQFARGSRYDQRSLRFARNLISGKRALPQYVLYAFDQRVTNGDAQNLYTISGKFGFYLESGWPLQA